MRETSQIVGKQAAAAESSDQTRKKTRMGERTLPEDLMYAEILPRIPAKYILRCRLVCKSWNSVFSRPAFVNSHLTHQLHNNSEENDRIITINGFHNNSEVKRDGLIEGVDILSHIDSNDYKALLFCYDSMSSPARQIFIYSTNSATWTCLCIPQNLMLPGLRDYFWMLLGHSTIVKGTPYWSCSKSLTFPGEKHLLKVFRTFKFVPEVNELRTLPDLDSLKCCGDTFSIVNIKDRLVGMTYNSVTHGGTNMVDMYCLDNEESGSGVWSKMYIIGPVNFGYNQRLLHAFRNGGEILIGGDSGTFACYDPKTKEIKSIAGTTSTRLSFRKFVGSRYSYTPSLVRVRGMKSIQNFSTKGELKEFTLFCLWNPAIWQIKLFDFPPQLHGHYLGFCWDHVHNDYKVLMLCCDPFLSPVGKISIYSANSATWASLCIPQNLVLPSMSRYPSTIVKGTPYWTYPKHKRKLFCTFKFVPEINELMILPDFDSLKFRVNNFNIANIKDRPVGMAYKLVEHGEANTMVDMYCMDDEDSGVWSKMYSIGPVYFDSNQRLTQAFRNGGEILIRGQSDPFAFYDPKTKEIKSIATTRIIFKERELGAQCYSYTPSLVLVRGMESMHNFSTKEELNQPAFFAHNFTYRVSLAG
ncbi:hypothetical protein ACET3Z_012688 [Daucus carota]